MKMQRPSLTKRQIDVLNLLVMGMSNRQIGEAADMTENTVKNYVNDIIEVYKADSRLEVALIAVRVLPLSKSDRDAIRHRAVESGKYSKSKRGTDALLERPQNRHEADRGDQGGRGRTSTRRHNDCGGEAGEE